MKALVLQGRGFEGLRITDVPRPKPGPGEVLVRLEAAALNHRDLWTIAGRGSSGRPAILGSDGAGTVVEVGPDVPDITSSEVVINPSLNWPGDRRVPPESFEILGFPTDGTLAEYIVISGENVEPKPAYLSWEEAAALPLSALTGYRALFVEGMLQPGETVVIPGAGGGTALQTFQLALAAGARTVVTSRGAAKRERLTQMGDDLVVSSETAWSDEVREFTGGKGADVVAESVGAATWEQSLRALARGGRLVVYGSTSGDLVNVELPPFFLSWQSIRGTTMGSQKEFRDMLRFVEERRITHVVDRVFSLDEGIDALRYLESGQQFGKVVLKM